MNEKWPIWDKKEKIVYFGTITEKCPVWGINWEKSLYCDQKCPIMDNKREKSQFRDKNVSKIFVINVFQVFSGNPENQEKLL